MQPAEVQYAVLLVLHCLVLDYFSIRMNFGCVVADFGCMTLSMNCHIQIEHSLQKLLFCSYKHELS